MGPVQKKRAGDLSLAAVLVRHLRQLNSDRPGEGLLDRPQLSPGVGTLCLHPGHCLRGVLSSSRSPSPSTFPSMLCGEPYSRFPWAAPHRTPTEQ